MEESALSNDLLLADSLNDAWEALCRSVYLGGLRTRLTWLSRPDYVCAGDLPGKQLAKFLDSSWPSWPSSWPCSWENLGQEADSILNEIAGEDK